MVLLIDNYDSFSYNLYQMIGQLQEEAGCTEENGGMCVVRNDALSPEQIRALSPDKIVISPGPGRPADAGYCIQVVQQLGASIPILGVCLGHQAICEAYGATVSYAVQLMHGKTSEASVDNSSLLFAGLAETVTVGRYHSLAALEETLPDCLQVTARAADGEIMAIQHREHPVYGVQFHPESILTPQGREILGNFLRS